MNKSKKKDPSRWKSREGMREAAQRAITKHAEAEALRLDLDPTHAFSYTLNYAPVKHLFKYIY